jgi:hypothetical protein
MTWRKNWGRCKPDQNLIDFWQKHISLFLMKTTTLQLPEPLLQKAVAKAKRLGVSQSKILRDAIEKDLADEQSGLTMYDLMADMCGCIKGGPTDMARRHKEYYREAILKKYGKNRR